MNTEVTFVTGNQNKLREVREILAVSPLVINSASLDIPELQGTPESVAIAKCKAAFAKILRPVIIEDTSLCFNALSGLPGVYIRDFYERLGNTGLSALLSGHTDKTAYAQCIFAYTSDGEDVKLFTGKTHGKIVDPRGQDTFGWDPVFECEGMTFAEMSAETKNAVSHRYKALECMRDYFLGSLGDLENLPK